MGAAEHPKHHHPTTTTAALPGQRTLRGKTSEKVFEGHVLATCCKPCQQYLVAADDDGLRVPAALVFCLTLQTKHPGCRPAPLSLQARCGPRALGGNQRQVAAGRCVSWQWQGGAGCIFPHLPGCRHLVTV